MTRDSSAGRALDELLLRSDLSGVPMETLISAGRYAREHRAELKEFTAKVAAQLHHEGLTWEQVGEKLEMQAMTAYRWAQPYL